MDNYNHSYHRPSYTPYYHPHYYPVSPPTPSEKQFALKEEKDPLLTRIKMIFLNFVTLGIAEDFQKNRFISALKEGRITTAQKIHQNGWISQIGEKALNELIQNKKHKSLNFLVNLEKTSLKKKEPQLSEFLANNIKNPKDFEALITSDPKFTQEMLNAFSKLYSLSFEQLEVLLQAGLKIKSDFPWVFSYGNAKVTPERMKVLLEYGMDPNIQNKHGSLLLHMITYPSYFPEIEKLMAMLLKAGAKPDATWIFSNRIPKITPDLMQLLLESGMDPNIKNNSDSLLIHMINNPSHFPEIEKSIEMLLKAGANPNATGSSKENALMIVIKKHESHPAIRASIKLLLQYGANPNDKATPTSKSPYEVALSTYRISPEYLTAFKDAGGETTMEILNRTFESQFSSADLKTLELFREYGAIANPQRATQRLIDHFNIPFSRISPSEQATFIETTKFLIDCGADTSVIKDIQQLLTQIVPLIQTA